MRGWSWALTFCLCLHVQAQERTFARIQTWPDGVRVYQMDELAQAIYLGKSDRSRLEVHPGYSSTVHLAFSYESPLGFRSWLDGILGPACPPPDFDPESDCVRQGWTVREQLQPEMGPFHLPLRPVDRVIEAVLPRLWWCFPLAILGLGWWRLRPDKVYLHLKVEPTGARVLRAEDLHWLAKAEDGFWVDRRGLTQNPVYRLEAEGFAPHFESVSWEWLRSARKRARLEWPQSERIVLKPAAEEPRGASWELSPGSRVQDYRVEERLGEGVSAVVYRVSSLHQPQAPHLALKLLKPSDFRGEDVAARFRREMKALSRLRHPHIPFLSDYGEYAGMGFLTMELLEGKPLSEFLPGLALEQALQYLFQLTSALDYAHRCGVLHRDIKPANVIVSSSDGSLRLTDFGLARSHDSSTLTMEGTMLGTPAYIAPEVVSGQPATALSDQYSLGCLAFELLLGRPPFQGDSPLAIAFQHLHQAPPSLLELLPSLAPELAGLLQQTLAKAPEQRLPNLAILMEHLAK